MKKQKLKLFDCSSAEEQDRFFQFVRSPVPWRVVRTEVFPERLVLVSHKHGLILAGHEAYEALAEIAQEQSVSVKEN